MHAFWQLYRREIYRFSSIWVQTILGPVTTALLYQLIFGYQFAHVNTGFTNLAYVKFLIPGLVMLLVLQNSFANASGTLVQSKYTGNIIFILMAPITPTATYFAYLLASMSRGIIVGSAVLLAIAGFGLSYPQNIFLALYFLIFGAAITSGLGLIVGIISEKFDQIAGFESFLIVPLIYLAGVFFNTGMVSGIWYNLAVLDPFRYIIDGFRYGLIGYATTNITNGVIFIFFATIFINLIGCALVGKLRR